MKWESFLLGYLMGRSAAGRELRVSDETLRRLDALRRELRLETYEDVIRFLIDYYRRHETRELP